MSGHTLPGVGDLLTNGGTKWVVNDIESAGQPGARWVLRPLYGGGADGRHKRRLPRADIQAYEVLRRRGEWTQP
ncbi:hypothetical protein [Streptomyces sp. NPDC093707]|uniref:hypothetical protein n=1 Tax=Streptomyces sp. NPDC093707 TaxID=3154984 RepID=UPI00344C509E